MSNQDPSSQYFNVSPTCVFGYVETAALLPHEALERERLEELRDWIREDGLLYHPVIADRESLVILDGHHRVHILGEVGCHLIPVYLVDYSDPSIRVFSRRPGIRVTKQQVIERGLAQTPFPPRTSRHVFYPPLRPQPTCLGKLRNP